MSENAVANERTAPKLDLHGTFLRRTSLRNANLENANLSRADFSYADFRGSDMKNTNLEGTILVGADLRNVKNLTLEQLLKAKFDDSTQLPSDLKKDVQVNG